MKPGLPTYLRAAFNARPLGMIVPPNWVGLAAFGLAGILNPGFWLIGAGVEAAYLLGLASNKRFQKVVAGRFAAGDRQKWERTLAAQVAALSTQARLRYETLSKRCRNILDQQASLGRQSAEAVAPLSDAGLRTQAESLSRLLWIYLRLLATRESIVRLLNESTAAASHEPVDRRIARVEAQLAAPGVNEELRRSLTAQLDILRQRQAGLRDARENLAFVDAELARIQEQVELIREQSVLAGDPSTVSHKIDAIGATLGSTSQWIRDRQELYGSTEDLLDDPPPLLAE